jgi:hypothetical protein
LKVQYEKKSFKNNNNEMPFQHLKSPSRQRLLHCRNPFHELAYLAGIPSRKGPSGRVLKFSASRHRPMPVTTEFLVETGTPDTQTGLSAGRNQPLPRQTVQIPGQES